MDKIRDILFGPQIRDYDKRFSRLEERLAKEAADVREELKRRFASLEGLLKNELGVLADAIKAEKVERGEADKELGRELRDSVKHGERKNAQAEEQAAKTGRELRQLVADEAKRLADEIELKHKEIKGALDKEARDLRTGLTDRLALADLFTEVAMRLKNEFKLPVKK